MRFDRYAQVSNHHQVHHQMHHQVNSRMKSEFTAVIERDGDWHIAYCPEITGANVQGKTVSEVRENLTDTIVLILEVRRENEPRNVLAGTMKETLTVE